MRSETRGSHSTVASLNCVSQPPGYARLLYSLMISDEKPGDDYVNVYMYIRALKRKEIARGPMDGDPISRGRQAKRRLLPISRREEEEEEEREWCNLRKYCTYISIMKRRLQHLPKFPLYSGNHPWTNQQINPLLSSSSKCQLRFRSASFFLRLASLSNCIIVLAARRHIWPVV